MKKPALSELTLREKIGQMANYSTIVLMEKMLANDEDVPLLGSVWGYGNLEESIVGELDKIVGQFANEDLYAAADYARFMEIFTSKCKIPPLAATDSTRGIYYKFHDLSQTMDPVTIAATGSAELAYKVGKAKGNELKCAGFRWVWGPEQDMENRNSAIGMGRKFSDDQDTVARLSNAEIKGLQDVNVAATAKHFPGADGLEYRDPHTAETILRLNKKDWWEHQGRVYQEVFDAGVYSVMVGHLAFPAVERTMINSHYIPSTISKKVVTDLLKGEMGFKGVVISDAIGMEGISSLFDRDLGRVSIEVIKAGCDMILGAPRDFVDVVEKAVLSGEIPESRIDDACQRILDMKDKIGLFDNPLEKMDVAECVAYTQSVNKEIAEKAVTLVCDNHNMLPLNKDKVKSVCIIFQGTNEDVFESLKYMEDELRLHGVEKIHRQIALHDEPEPSTLPLGFDIMLYVPHIGGHSPWGIAGFQGELYKTFYRVGAGGQRGKRIVLNIGTPNVCYDYYSTFNCVVNAYNTTEITQRCAIKALYGELPLNNNHPFSIVPKGYEINFD